MGPWQATCSKTEYLFVDFGTHMFHQMLNKLTQILVEAPSYFILTCDGCGPWELGCISVVAPSQDPLGDF